MPSPISFAKNLLIWVDDIPANNQGHIQDLLNKDIEVVQLMSTRMAEKWSQ